MPALLSPSQPTLLHDRLGSKSKSLATLPTSSECDIHLQFLECIVALKGKLAVENEDWNSYLENAVSRFQIWITHFLKDDESSSRLPPLDVLIVWHSFMLNPGPYTKFEREITQG